MSMQQIIRSFCGVYLNCDPDWLEVEENTFDYWPGRFAQRFSVEETESGDLKWRMAIPLVEGVQDPERALWLCLRLNRYAAGWSFAFNRRDASIHALSAMSRPLAQDRFLLRFSQAASHASWFCELIAEGLASAVGGAVMTSVPPGRSSPRRVPDAVLYEPTALRERPEWVYDPTSLDFPDLSEISVTFFAGAVNADLELAQKAGPPYISSSDTFFSFESPRPGQPWIAEWMDQAAQTLGMIDPVVVQAGFDRHPLMGSAWRSEARTPWVPVEEWAEAASACALWLYEHPQTDLLGAWVDQSDDFAFRSWAATHELRGYEKLPSFEGHRAEDLWLTFARSNQAVIFLEQQVRAATQTTPPPERLDRVEQFVLGPVHTGESAINEVLPTDGDTADRRFLWWPSVDVLLIQGWFNPSGPTLQTLERRINPATGEAHLLMLQRHPFLPTYLDLGPWSEQTNFEDAAEVLCRGWTPNFALMLADGAERDDLHAAIRRGWSQVLAGDDGGKSFGDRAHAIWSTLGEPWAYAGQSFEGLYAAAKNAHPEPTADSTFEDWWAMVTNDLNVDANLRLLPDAWDGALNYLQTVGDLAEFDVGPFLVTYGLLGMVDKPHLSIQHLGQDASTAVSLAWRNPNVVTISHASSKQNARGDVLSVAQEISGLLSVGGGVLHIRAENVSLADVLSALAFGEESSQEDWDDWDEADDWLGDYLSALLEDGFRIGRWRITINGHPVRVITSAQVQIAVAWQWDNEVLDGPVWREPLFEWQYTNDAPIGFQGSGCVGWVAHGVLLDHVSGDWDPAIRVHLNPRDPVATIGTLTHENQLGVPVLRSLFGFQGIPQDHQTELYELDRAGGHARLYGDRDFLEAVVHHLVTADSGLTAVVEALTDPESERGSAARRVLERMKTDTEITWYDVDEALRGETVPRPRPSAD